MKLQSDIYKSVALGAFIILLSGFTYDLWSAIGLGLVGFIFTLYLLRLGKTIPLLELMILISTMQWILGAHQSYVNEYNHFKYYMYVERTEYMSTVVPGVIAFILGVLTFYPKFNFERVNNALMQYVSENPRLPLILILTGITFSYLINFFPPALSFIIYLLSNFQFVGAALWLFKPGRVSSLLGTIVVLGLVFFSSIQVGGFHDLLLWAGLLLSFIVLRFNLGMQWRLLLVLSGFFLAFIIQSVKTEYRTILYEGLMPKQESTEIFSDLVQDRLENLEELLSDEVFLTEINVRLNQGWIISSIIQNMPHNEPYAEGRTVIEAFKASMLPRFLAPGKKIAGGRENFELFTGLKLHKSASMGISILGEAYANFGKQGSWVFMYFWGIFLTWGYARLIKYATKRVIIYVFIPLVFLQVIKAETELYVVLNHFVKTIILVFTILWGARKFLKWNV